MEKKYRYPGVKPFSEDQSAIFFGRDNDIRNLVRNIEIEDLVVLHGKSGLGKTSLINAGVFPSLEKLETLHDVHPVYIRFNNYNPASPIHPLDVFLSIFNAPPSVLDEVPVKRISMWQCVKSLELANIGKDIRIMLFFDQFEELFTYPEEMVEEFGRQLADLSSRQMPSELRKAMRRERAINDKLAAGLESKEVEDLLEKPVFVKLILSIRSDKLSLLDRLKPFLPRILGTSYELEPLSRDQAQSAIIKPGIQDGDFDSGKFSYDEAAIKKILDFLTENSSKRVEAFQLQIICQHLERKVIQEKLAKIGLGHIEEDLGSILKNYYDDQVRKFDDPKEREIVQRLIEDGLILPKEQRRVSLDEGQLRETYPVTDDILSRLVDTRIVRRQRNTVGGFSFELSHDTLIEPILRSREERIQEEKKAEEIRKARKRDKERREALEAELMAQKRDIAKRRRLLLLVSLLGIVMFGAGIGYQYYRAEQNQKKLDEKSSELVVTKESLGEAQSEISQSTDYYEYLRQQYGDDINVVNENYQLVKENKVLEKQLAETSASDSIRMVEMKAQWESELLQRDRQIAELQVQVKTLSSSGDRRSSGSKEDIDKWIRLNQNLQTKLDSVTRKVTYYEENLLKLERDIKGQVNEKNREIGLLKTELIQQQQELRRLQAILDEKSIEYQRKIDPSQLNKYIKK